ncbi:hypothetical protein Tco_1012180 [Tanacetum coccineum]
MSSSCFCSIPKNSTVILLKVALPSHIRCSDVFNVKHLLPYHGDSSDDDLVVNSRANFVYLGGNDAGPSIEERPFCFWEAPQTKASRAERNNVSRHESRSSRYCVNDKEDGLQGTDISKITRKQSKNGQARTRESKKYKKKPKNQSQSQKSQALSQIQSTTVKQ